MWVNVQKIIIIINLYNLMYFEDEVQLPALIPIRTKKKKKDDEQMDHQLKEEFNNEVINILARQFDKQKEEREMKKQEKPVKPSLGPEKIEQFDKKFHNLQEKGGSKRQEKSSVKQINNKERQNQKSKHIITEMMKKIDAKNISEQLYPVTSQAILKAIKQIDQEVEELKITAQRKESILITNPNNQHLKMQLQTLKVSIDRCVTIKQLYNEKINLRNKVSILERNIIQLKEENQNLKIKNYRDTEDQENHSNGLPCYRQKQLKDELTKCNLELQKQKGMREKLQNNINEIVQNFKRLYQEADTARLIVTRKLKEIQQKEKNINDQSISQPQPEPTNQKKSSPKQDPHQGKRIKYSQGNELDPAKTQKKSPSFLPLSSTDGRLKEGDRTASKSVLQEHIYKMRANQATMSKNNLKR